MTNSLSSRLQEFFFRVSYLSNSFLFNVKYQKLSKIILIIIIFFNKNSVLTFQFMQI